MRFSANLQLSLFLPAPISRSNMHIAGVLTSAPSSRTKHAVEACSSCHERDGRVSISE